MAFSSFKIILAIENFPPQTFAGTEIYVLNLARYLRQKNHSVSIVIPHSESGEYEYEGFKVYKYKISSKSTADELNGFIPPVGIDEFESILNKLEPDLVHFHSFNRVMNSWHFKAAKQMGTRIVFTTHVAGLFCMRGDLCYKGKVICDGKIRSHRCMACYVHQKIGYPILSELLALGFNFPNLFLPWLRNFKPFLYSVRKKKEDLKRIDRYTDKIISISKWMLDTYKINGLKNVVQIVHEIVKGGFQSSETIADDVDIVPPSLNQKKDKIKLIFVGRLYPIKNIELLLEALSLVDFSRFNLTMAVIPDKNSSSYYTKIKGKYDSMGFNDWHENVSDQELKQRISSSDMLCLPSKSEVAPLVVKEAFNCGVPILGSDIPAIKELVTHGKNGLLFNVNDMESLKQLLCDMINDRSILLNLKKNVVPMTDISLFYQKIEETYKEVMEI